MKYAELYDIAYDMIFECEVSDVEAEVMSRSYCIVRDKPTRWPMPRSNEQRRAIWDAELKESTNAC